MKNNISMSSDICRDGIHATTRLCLFVCLSLLGIPMCANGQNRPLPITDLPGSTSSVAMGGTRFGGGDMASVYAGATSAYTMGCGQTSVSYTLGVVDDAPANTFHTLAASHRQGRSVLMLGARYFSQGTIHDAVDADMKPLGKSINLYSYMADVGYAHLLGHFTFISTVGVVTEKAATQSNAWRMSVGASYHDVSGRASWMLGIGADNLGVMAADGTSKALSPLVHGGGRLAFDIAPMHRLELSADGGAYLPMGGNSTATTVGGGVGYTFMSNYTVRAGYHAGDGDGYVGAGVSCRIGHLRVDAAAKLACTDNLYNVYMVGLGMDF